MQVDARPAFLTFRVGLILKSGLGQAIVVTIRPLCALLPALDGSGINETVSLGPLGSPFVVLVVPYILGGHQ